MQPKCMDPASDTLWNGGEKTHERAGATQLWRAMSTSTLSHRRPSIRPTRSKCRQRTSMGERWSLILSLATLGKIVSILLARESLGCSRQTQSISSHLATLKVVLQLKTCHNHLILQATLISSAKHSFVFVIRRQKGETSITYSEASGMSLLQSSCVHVHRFLIYSGGILNRLSAQAYPLPCFSLPFDP